LVSPTLRNEAYDETGRRGELGMVRKITRPTNLLMTPRSTPKHGLPLLLVTVVACVAGRLRHVGCDATVEPSQAAVETE
jgi:hypothetical protein